MANLFEPSDGLSGPQDMTLRVAYVLPILGNAGYVVSTA